MTRLTDLPRRSFLRIAAALGGASTVGALPNLVGAQDKPQQTDVPATTLQDVPLSSGAKLTIERRGQIVLFGINRPYIQNRIDPETFEKLAEAYYQYDHDPSLRAAILFGHGENFSRGIDVEGFKSLAGTGKRCRYPDCIGGHSFWTGREHPRPVPRWRIHRSFRS